MPAGGRNLYILSQNSPIGSNNINEFSQNISTGEISFKVTGRDPFFGAQANRNEALGPWRGIKIPVNGQDIAVKLTNELFVKNFVSYFGEDDKAVKNFKNYQTNKFIIPADELEGVSYVTFRFGLVQETQEIGSVHTTKVKVEYGNTHTDWSPAPEDLWSTGALVPTQQQRYLWKFEYVYYSDGSVEVIGPVNLSIAGADADTTGVTDAINQTNQTVAGLQSSVSQAQSDLATVSSNLTQARQNLENSIASVNTKAQAVETTLAQVQSTANANSQKTATLETGLNGLTAKFNNLSVGNKNYLPASRVVNRGCTNFKYNESSKSWTMTAPAGATGFGKGITFNIANLDVRLFGEETLYFGMLIKADKACKFVYDINNWLSPSGSNSNDNDDRSKAKNSNLNIPAGAWTKVWFSYTAKPNTVIVDSNSTCGITDNKEDVNLEIKDIMVAKSNVPVDYQMPDADIEQKVADYKQTADQNYASLQSTVQALDGTVTANKTTADQTAAGFKTRIESLETYKDGETARANQYFESAKTETARQLTAERTAIANDYVAKSTYTSDVTGLRNDLTATTTTANTTKTNLASYQASNDQAVASLQSSLQTTNGNVSNLQTKVEAVPGQITSAVSAVEGKIPTEIGSSNLLRNTSVNADNLKLFGTSNAVISIAEKDGHQTYKIKVGPTQQNNSGAQFAGNDGYYNLVKDRYYTFSYWIWTSVDKQLNLIKLGHIQACNYHDDKVGSDILHQHTTPTYSTNKILAEQWTKVWYTFKVTSNSYFKPFFWYLDADDEIYIYDMMLNEGKIPLSYTPAPEDTATQINSLSSQIQQTADGMTLLATKTELNTAKTDLQSGITTATSKADNAQSTANNNAQTISTHTTQISALNTGLSAKVSQSDFNTLSGRVTTAENNITAKANELSSKITSVEGLIPTSIDTVNLMQRTDKPFTMGYGITNTTWDDDKKWAYLDLTDPSVSTTKAGEILPQGQFYNFNPAKGMTYTQSIMIDTDATFNPNGQMEFSWFANGLHNTQKAYIKKVGAYSYQVWSTYTWNSENTALRAFDLFNLHNVLLFRTTGTYLAFYKPKLTTGNLPSDWSPSTEDYDSKLATAQSEIKQTTDAITASVSSVEAKADNAQTTASSAVSKANAAQTAINTLDSEVVKSANLNLDNNGFVTKVGKTINGNKFATMIAQDANNVKIIADEMQVTANMIVDGAVTAEKLDVNNLSAVNSDLGEIKGGSLLLQENKAAGSATDSWGTYDRPAYKQGLYMDNRALASSGAIQRKNGGESTPTDMPLAVLQAGELRFLVVDYNDNLKNVVHYGLSDPDFGAIRFEIDSELKRRLTMTSSGYLNFQATNYTNWQSTGVSGCEYMIQGRLVVVNYDITFNSAGTHTIGGIPQEFTKKSLMMTAKAWSILPDRDRNIQLNPDGGLHILNAEANVNYRGTLVFSY